MVRALVLARDCTSSAERRRPELCPEPREPRDPRAAAQRRPRCSASSSAGCCARRAARTCSPTSRRCASSRSAPTTARTPRRSRRPRSSSPGSPSRAPSRSRARSPATSTWPTPRRSTTAYASCGSARPACQPHHLAPDDSLPAAVAQLADEVGRGRGARSGSPSSSSGRCSPPTRPRPAAARSSSAIRRIAELVAERDLRYIGGMSLAENDRRLLSEIDTLWRTAPLRQAKPSVLDEVAYRASTCSRRPSPTCCRPSTDASTTGCWPTPPGRRLPPCARSPGSARGSAATGTATRTSPREITRGRRGDGVRARAARAGGLRAQVGPRTHPRRLGDTRLARARRAVAEAARAVRDPGGTDRRRRPERAAPSGRLLPRGAHRGHPDPERRPRLRRTRRSSRPTSPWCSARWPRPAPTARPTATCSG